MKLKIVTPERVVLDEDVEAVYAKAVDGEVGILPKHIPMVTPLEIGSLSYVKAGQKVPAAVMGGLLSTDGYVVTVLSEASELRQDIDKLRAQQAKERAEARLREKAESVDFTRAERALARAAARLKTSV
ncbi:MAG: ATP synthase F1 subunit epsilon [Vampirovibrionales bacterium]|nr:ATP synthase F1 subunit epsilon [Vampirovibrionales bacterium]